MVSERVQLQGRAAVWQRALVPSEWYESRRGRSANDWVVDSALFVSAAIIGGLAQGYIWSSHGGLVNALDLAFGSLACLALWARRSRPMAVLVAAAAGVFSPLALGAALVAIFNAAMRGRGRALAVVALLALAGSAAFPLLNPAAGPVLGQRFPGFMLTAIAFGWGILVRARREMVVSLRERAERLEAEQQRSAELAREAERRRIAREMHDVLAHRLSLLSVHAGALEFRPDAPAAEISEAAGVIRTSAAAALDEHEDPGEHDAGKKAERSKQEGKGEVGVETGHPCQQAARNKPDGPPGDAHADCAADASPPFLHDYLPMRNRTRVSCAGDRMPSTL